MKPFTQVRSRIITLPDAHIDTDRIIPARFLTTTTSAGLGQHAFANWRYMPDGSKRADCPLNDPRAEGAQIIVAGHNFGCGSSREHAAWALADMGIRAVLSSEVADIFRLNAVRNGILPIVITPEQTASLLEQPFTEIEIDLEACSVRTNDGDSFSFTVDPFARQCLLQGVDQLGYLLQHMDAIDAFDQKRGVLCEQ